MLSSIRKVQKTVLIIVTIIICIAFAWLYTQNETGGGSGANVALWVGGKPYRGSEVMKMANQFTVAEQLGRSGSIELALYAYEMYGRSRMELFNPQSRERDRTNFVTRLIVLRAEAKKLAVEPSPEEIEKKIAEFPAFLNDEGEFSEGKLQDFLRLSGGRLALTRGDIEQMVGDFLKFNKLKQLVGAGMKPSNWEVEQEYFQKYEQFEAHEIFIKSEGLAEGIEISEEAIKAEYEENKGDYQSAEKRGIEYVAMPLPQPPPPAPPIPQIEDPTVPGIIPEPEMTPEQLQKKANDVKSRANQILGRAAEGVSLEDTLLAMNLENKPGEPVLAITEAEPFAFDPDSAPGALKEEFGLMRRVFTRLESDIGVLDAAEGAKHVFLYRVTEIVPPADLPLEDAREQIVETLKAKEIRTRLEAAAAEAKTKIEAEIAKGIWIADAAKAAGLEAVELKPFTRSDPPEGSDHAGAIGPRAPELEPGEVSDPQYMPDGALLIYLASRELPERESAETDRDAIFTTERTRAVEGAFNAWFGERIDAADPKYPIVENEKGEKEPRSIEIFNRS